MEALKAAWARVRSSAGVFAHSAITELEDELAKVHSAYEMRLAAIEAKVGITPAAPPAPAEKPAA